MSQHDMILDDAAGAVFLADVNAAIQALASNSKGSSRPSTVYPGQFWVDEDSPSSTVWSLYFYDGTDDILVGYVDITNNRFVWVTNKGADVASAATINLDNVTGEYCDVTGTTTCTAITLTEGRTRTIRATGAMQFTNSASLAMMGAANLTTAAGDFLTFKGYAAGVVRQTAYMSAGGMAKLASPAFTGVPTAPTPATSDNSTTLATTAYVKAQSALNGTVLQIAESLVSTVATGAAIIPFDNTIPQNTEGTAFTAGNLAFTPLSASSTLIIDTFLWLSTAEVDDVLIGALFVDSTASAVAAGFSRAAQTAGPMGLHFSYKVPSASTTLRTYKPRFGGNNATTITVNGYHSAGIFGGVMKSGIRVTEILV